MPEPLIQGSAYQLLKVLGETWNADNAQTFVTLGGAKALSSFTPHEAAVILGSLSKVIQVRSSRYWVAHPEELEKFFGSLNQIPREASTHSQSNPILFRLFEGEEIVIEATDGRETMAGAKKTFPGYLDGDFKSWGTDKPGRATEREVVSIFEMREDATFAQMFGSLGDPRTLVLQQAQIVEFCRTHRNRLRSDGYATFFLFEVEGDKGPEVFVARVHVHGRELQADVDRFGDSNFWIGDYRRRLVVPMIHRLL